MTPSRSHAIDHERRRFAVHHSRKEDIAEAAQWSSYSRPRFPRHVLKSARCKRWEKRPITADASRRDAWTLTISDRYCVGIPCDRPCGENYLNTERPSIGRSTHP